MGEFVKWDLPADRNKTSPLVRRETEYHKVKPNFRNCIQGNPKSRGAGKKQYVK